MADAPFDTGQLKAAARDAYLAVAAALVRQHPDPVRHLLTEDCWGRLRQRVETLRLDGSRQVFDRIMITDARLLAWELSGGSHVARLRLMLSGVRCIIGADGRVLLGARASDQWGEDWRLVRSADPEILAAANAPRCPACGAPLEIDDDGLCRYCRAVVPGAKSDWLVDDMADAVDDNFTAVEGARGGQEAFQTVAAAASLDREGATPEPAGPHVSPAAMVALYGITQSDPEFNVGDFAVLAREAFLALDRARVELNPMLARAHVTDAFFAAEVQRAGAARAAGRHDVPTMLDIDGVEVTGATTKDGWQELGVRVNVRSARHVVELATGTVVGGSDAIEPWSADMVFVRRQGARTNPYREADTGICPACGGGLEVLANGCCAACGQHLTSGEYGWVLSAT